MSPRARPRVLVLTPWAPYPYDGGSKRVHTLCRLLTDRFRLSLLTFRARVRGHEEAARDLRREALELRPLFESVHWVEAPDAPGPESAHGVPIPEDARRFYSEPMADRLHDLLSRGEADLLQVEFDLMAAYGLGERRVPRLLTQHDMGGASFFGSYLREMAGWGKFTRVSDWLVRSRYARETALEYDRVVVMTDPDLRALRRLAPGVSGRCVPTGVDLAHFAPPHSPVEEPRLAFVGHYPHYPNEDAALRLVREIFPEVRRRVPGATLSLIGSDPTPAVREAAAGVAGVTLSGTVPDVKPLLAAASVFLAPVRLGRGIKGKILEAFAMGLPVVASSAAAEGIGAVPGRDLLIADGSAVFVSETVSLLNSPERRRSLGAAGRRLVEERYDWRALSARLGYLYDELL